MISSSDLLLIEEEIDGVFSLILKAHPRVHARRQEKKMADSLIRSWRSASSAALNLAMQPLLAADYTLASINAFVTRMGVKLAKPLTKAQVDILKGRLKSIYSQAKKFTAKQVKVGFTFNLVDTRAVSAINRQQVFWVGDFYSAKLSERIRAVSEDVLLKQGLSQREAGKLLHKVIKQEFGVTKGGPTKFAPTVPARYAGKPQLYFNGVAATSAHQAQTFGTLNAMREAEVSSYRLLNPMDERTGRVCQLMNGQTFTVSSGVEKMNSILAAKTPDEVRESAPWLNSTSLQGVLGDAAKGSKDATDRLTEAGVQLPPFHMLCRTEVVVIG